MTAKQNEKECEICHKPSELEVCVECDDSMTEKQHELYLRDGILPTEEELGL